MPFSIPSLATTLNQVRQDFIARSDTGDAVLRQSVESAIAYGVAGIAHGLYQYQTYILKQAVPGDENDLDTVLRWAARFLTTPQTPASAAQGDVTFTGVDTTTIPAGTEVATRDGVAYTTDVEGDIGDVTTGELTVAVTAVLEAAAGNAAVGVTVSLSTPIAGVNADATVAAGALSGGADAEGKESILRRLTTRFQSPPRGGNTGDYKAWAEEISGIEEAYEFPDDPNVGWVKVVVMDRGQADLKAGAFPIKAAQENIDLKRPIGIGGSTVLGPTSTDLALTLTGLIVDDAGNRTAVEAAIEAYVFANTKPGVDMEQADIENAAQNTAGISTVSISSPAPGPISPTGDYGIFNSTTITWVPASPP